MRIFFSLVSILLSHATCATEQAEEIFAQLTPSLYQIKLIDKASGEKSSIGSGFQISADELKNLAAQLKRHCGTGGSVKDGVLILQGDHRNTLINELKNRGFEAKFAGG